MLYVYSHDFTTTIMVCMNQRKIIYGGGGGGRGAISHNNIIPTVCKIYIYLFGLISLSPDIIE